MYTFLRRPTFGRHPQNTFDELNAEFNFTLDPCSTKENSKCKKYFTKEHNGLSQSWDGEVVFMNPPYGREIGMWIEKARHSKACVVMLIPARTDTKYFHEFLYQKDDVELRFLKGRLKFGNAINSAPFPSLVAISKAHLLIQ